MEFKADPSKAASNLTKHETNFSEAETVFGDPLALTFYDTKHSDTEDRWLTFGISETGKYLVVWHTETDETVRIIGAKKMDKTERYQYEHYKR